MPVKNHLGQQLALKGSAGQRFKVYVMGPSGLVTIDPVAVFSPGSGTYADDAVDLCEMTLTCTTAAVWTWSKSGPGYGTVASGGSATSITFGVASSPRGGLEGGTNTESATFTVSATSHGVTATYTIHLTALGSGV